MNKDRLFAELRSDAEAFAFDNATTAVFADMIRRSVPGYANVIAMTGVIAAEHAKPGTSLYDLGCSLGAGLRAMSQNTDPSCHLIGVDNSKAMLQACRQKIETLPQKVELLEQDITKIDVQNASVIALNYTLQFIKPRQRQATINQLYRGLLPGGALILSEKVHHEETQKQQEIEHWYYAFKRQNGYSELEIAQKRNALENVLITDTSNEQQARLEKAGFRRVYPWFQQLNFVSFIAIK